MEIPLYLLPPLVPAPLLHQVVGDSNLVGVPPQKNANDEPIPFLEEGPNFAAPLGDASEPPVKLIRPKLHRRWNLRSARKRAPLFGCSTARSQGAYTDKVQYCTVRILRPGVDASGNKPNPQRFSRPVRLGMYDTVVGEEVPGQAAHQCRASQARLNPEHIVSKR